MRFRRSVPAPWMVRANSTCLAGEVAVRVVAELLAENQDAVQRRPQLVRHVGQELGLVLRRQRQLARPSLRARGAPARFPGSCVRLRRSARRAAAPSARAARWSAAARVCCVCNSLGELLRLLQQAFGLHRGLDAVEHDADARRELLEEHETAAGSNSCSEASSMTALIWSSNITGRTMRLRRRVRRTPSRCGRASAGTSVMRMRALVDGALADQACRRAAARSGSRSSSSSA